MTCSEAEGAYRAFRREHGLGERWTVRFSAEETRAREVARQYRKSGYDVRVLPLSPEGEELDPGALGAFEAADHDPLRHTEADACAPCLRDTYLVLTRPNPSASPSTDLPYG